MDAYPTFDYLVDGMKAAGTTSSWDVVVSYSVDKLNDLLKTLWTSNHAGTEIKVQTKGLDADDEPYYADWNLKLGSPTLSFTLDNRAFLVMPLSGTRQAEATDGKTHPVKKIPDGLYVFKAVVPLRFVRAKEGDKEGKDPKSSAQTIDFEDGDPDSKLHVVFQFDTDDLANYNIEHTASPTPDETDFGDLSTKVAAWLHNPANLSAITYSLAVVATDQTIGAVYLTPEKVAFSVYSNGGTVGCLCVYIKTKDSGFEPGDVTRAFKLPNKNGEQTYPIPKDYSSSIIIRRDIFEKKFLSDSLKAVTDSNQKHFSSVTSKAVSTGFSFDIRLDNTIAKNFSDINWAGLGLHVKPIDWKLADVPLQFNVTNNKVDWSFQADYSIDWSIVVSTRNPPSGTVKYHIHVGQSNLPLLQVSQKDIDASVGLTSSYWNTSIDSVKPNTLETIGGMVASIPGEIRNGLNAIVFPTFSSTMRLDYFATTNIFAPNKHIIDIDTAKGILTPYDVMIVGHVAENASAPSLSANFLSRSAAASVFYDGPSSTKGAAQFVNDLASGQPIFMKTIDAIYTGDAEKLDAVVKDSGYTFTFEDLQTTVQSAESGAGFDIRFVAGLYSFTEPSDLKKSIMTVNPSTAKISIDDVVKNNSTNAKGEVVWKDGDYTYTIIFKYTYNSEGLPNPVTFSGSRVKSTGGSESVSGSQIFNSPHWTSTDGSLTTAFVATVFGTLLGIATTAVSAWMWAKKRMGQDTVRNSVEAARQDLPHVQDSYHPDVHYDVFADDVEIQVSQSVNRNLRDGLDPSDHDDREVIQEAASEAARNYLHKSGTALLKPASNRRWEPYAQFSHNAEALPLILESTVDDSLRGIDAGLQAQGSYVLSLVELTVLEQQAVDALENSIKFKNAANKAFLAAEALREEKRRTETAKKEREQELKDQNDGITQNEINADKTVKSLTDKIEELEKQAQEQDKEAVEAEEQKAKALQEADNTESEVERQKKIAEELKEEAYREKS